MNSSIRILSRQLTIRVIVACALHATSLLLIRLSMAPTMLRPAALVAGIVIVCGPLVALALAEIPIGRFAEPFGVMLIYAVPSLLFFAPFLKTFTTHVIGNADSYQAMWDAWWIKQVFTAGKPLFFTDAVFAPVGASLAPLLLPIQSMAIALLGTVLGDAPAFNIVAFLAVPLAGLGAYTLCRSLDYPKPASIAAGFVLAWSPFLTSKFGWLNLSYCGFLALFAAAMIPALPLEGKPAAVRTIAILALATLALQFSGDVTIVFAANLVVARLLACSIRQRSVTRPLRQAIRAFTPAMIALLPFILVFVASLPEYWGAISRDATTYRYNPTPLNYLLPSAYWSIYGGLVKSLANPGLRSGDMSCYLGLLVFPLAVLGWYATRQRLETRFWAGVAALFLILSFGPYMVVNGTRILLPFALWSRLPVLGSVGQSGRYTVLVYLAMAIGVAAWLSVRRQGHLTALGTILVIAADFAFVPTTNPLPRVPPLSGISGAVMDVRIYTGETMYYQTKHGRPLVGGYLPRTPRSAREYYDRSPCVDWLMSATPVSPCDHESMGRALADLNVTDVFTKTNDPRQPEFIRLGFRRSYLDDRSAVWLPPTATDPAPGGR
jgi:hypothetical protein